MKNLIVLFVIAIALSSCSDKNQTGTDYWINSFKVECTGVGQKQCLQVQKGDSIVFGQWQNFYSSIEGFEYEPGFIYHLRVKEEKLADENVPDDASSINYTLIEVIDKKRDTTSRIHDIWALEQIDGQEIDFSSASNDQNHPRLEFNMNKMRVMGNNGCNSLSGEIKQINQKNISLGPVAATKKACRNMEIPAQFNAALQKVVSYNIKNLELLLFDETGKEVLRFKKID